MFATNSKKTLAFAQRDVLGLLGLALVCLILFCGLFGGWLAPYDPLKLDVPSRLLAPSLAHPFGTDKLGRDVFSRILAGSGLALQIGIIPVLIAVAAGVVLGLISGYGPRWLDAALLLLFDTTYSYPIVIIGLAFVTVFGASTTTLMTLVVLFLTPAYARLIRTGTLSVKSSVYVSAARTMGASALRILGVHVLPNVIGPVLIVACMDIPSIIALEAGLTYLGLGVPPPAPSWGRILEEGTGSIREAPWIVLAGGLPIILATLGFTFCGEALRSWLDPKQAGRSP